MGTKLVRTNAFYHHNGMLCGFCGNGTPDVFNDYPIDNFNRPGPGLGSAWRSVGAIISANKCDMTGATGLGYALWKGAHADEGLFAYDPTKTYTISADVDMVSDDDSSSHLGLLVNMGCLIQLEMEFHYYDIPDVRELTLSVAYGATGSSVIKTIADGDSLAGSIALAINAAGASATFNIGTTGLTNLVALGVDRTNWFDYFVLHGDVELPHSMTIDNLLTTVT